MRKRNDMTSSDAASASELGLGARTRTRSRTRRSSSERASDSALGVVVAVVLALALIFGVSGCSVKRDLDAQVETTMRHLRKGDYEGFLESSTTPGNAAEEDFQKLSERIRQFGKLQDKTLRVYEGNTKVGWPSVRTVKAEYELKLERGELWLYITTIDGKVDEIQFEVTEAPPPETSKDIEKKKSKKKSNKSKKKRAGAKRGAGSEGPASSSGKDWTGSEPFACSAGAEDIKNVTAKLDGTAITVSGTCVLTLRDVDISAERAIVVTERGSVTLLSGKLAGTKTAISVRDEGSVIISGGTIKGGKYALDVSDEGEIITSGKIDIQGKRRTRDGGRINGKPAE